MDDMARIKSQLDVCGAPMTMSLGSSGTSPTRRQPIVRSIDRPNHRVTRLPVRGMLGLVLKVGSRINKLSLAFSPARLKPILGLTGLFRPFDSFMQ